MNLTFRMRIVQLALWLFRFTFCGWRLTIGAWGILVGLAISVGRGRGHRRLKTLQKTVAVLQQKANAIIPELQTLGSLPDDRKQQIMAARSVLLEENKHLQTAISELRSARLPGAVVFTYALTRMQYKALSRQRKAQSLSRIRSRIDCDTFYWDLILWLVTPGAHIEELLGDLDEEYLLRTSADGEAAARAWYLNEVTTTIKDFVRKKIERMAAIGTLIDEQVPTATIVLLDQPTIVTNPQGQRPVENIVGSAVSLRYGGMQPANTSKKEMFGTEAPMWPFLTRFGGPADPLEPVADTRVFETYRQPQAIGAC